MRYMVYDENSDIGNSTYAVYDPFEITMNWYCTEDSVTILDADSTNTQTYIIDSDTVGAATT